MTSELPVIVPDWPAPSWVHAACTTRMGGVSQAPWQSLNLGTHVGDHPDDVAKNRSLLGQWAEPGAQSFGWLNQVHGTDVVELPQSGAVTADASVTSQPGVACVVMTADCLPVLLVDDTGATVAAAHAGWRGLAAGVLERTVATMAVAPSRLRAWLGPAIGPTAFEVGAEVRAAFLARDAGAGAAFRPAARRDHYFADLPALATRRLQAVGIRDITASGICTVTSVDRCPSFRRDPRAGRMASLIWRDARA